MHTRRDAFETAAAEAAVQASHIASRDRSHGLSVDSRSPTDWPCIRPRSPLSVCCANARTILSPLSSRSLGGIRNRTFDSECSVLRTPDPCPRPHMHERRPVAAEPQCARKKCAPQDCRRYSQQQTKQDLVSHPKPIPQRPTEPSPSVMVAFQSG